MSEQAPSATPSAPFAGSGASSSLRGATKGPKGKVAKPEVDGEVETVKIEMHTSQAGHIWRDGQIAGQFVRVPGGQYDVPVDEAQRLVDADYAHYVDAVAA